MLLNVFLILALLARVQRSCNIDLVNCKMNCKMTAYYISISHEPINIIKIKYAQLAQE